MANSLNVNPAVFTTTQASYKAAVSASQGTLFTLLIKRIVWEAPSTVGHQCLIIDPQSGRTLFRMVADAANKTIEQDWTARPQLWADFAVDQLDSGNLYIHFA